MRRIAVLAGALLVVMSFDARGVGAEPVFNPDNGHYYDAVPGLITWSDAKAAAESLVFDGRSGHLATITSLAENDFIVTNLPLAASDGFWLGGFQPEGSPEPAGGWEWVTGEPWVFTRWGSTEPNNTLGIEDELQFWPSESGFWNDSRWSNAGYVVEFPGIAIPVDIKPGSCPNPLNVNSEGDLSVAILGTGDLDVGTIDPASIRLAGVAPLRSNYEDVGTHFEPYLGREDCEFDCHEMEGDGWMDLTFKFDTQEVAAALGDVQGGECIVVGLTGVFWPAYGGGRIVGEDVVVILDRAARPRMATARVMNEVDPGDIASQPLKPRN